MRRAAQAVRHSCPSGGLGKGGELENLFPEGQKGLPEAGF